VDQHNFKKKKKKKYYQATFTAICATFISMQTVVLHTQGFDQKHGLQVATTLIASSFAQ